MLFKGNGGFKGKERRSQERKDAGRVSAEVHNPPRKSERKLPPPDMRASVLVDHPGNGIIEDVSREGLKISSPILLKEKSQIGVHFRFPDKDSGVTLICQVVWSQPWGAGMAHQAGLQIIKTTDDQGFVAFVDRLPSLA